MVDHAGILMEQGRSMACERVCGVNDNIEKAHYHSYYEIYYMEAGERHFVINNQPYFARQGDFVLFSPYIMHTDCVSEIMDYINYHYQEDLTLQKLADLLFISPPYLCKIFKEYANQTVVQYINTTRILNAQRMVMETEDRITEISRSVGFVNVTHFNRVFKSITGITPSVFRKRVRMRENK